MTTVYEFPREWLTPERCLFRLASRSQSAARPWLGGKSVRGPHAQFWTCQITLTGKRDPDRQRMAAFMSRLDGQAGLLRMTDPHRLKPWRDREATSSSESYSDGTRFTDGTGFDTSLLPPNLYVAAAANRGDNFVVLGGLPTSTADVFTRGDLFEHKPGGVADGVPRLYEMMVGGSSDASGRIGVEIRPRLRTGIAAGDQVSLRRPSTVFRLVDDDQGAMEVTRPVIGSMGFSLIEALDQVP